MQKTVLTWNVDVHVGVMIRSVDTLTGVVARLGWISVSKDDGGLENVRVNIHKVRSHTKRLSMNCWRLKRP